MRYKNLSITITLGCLSLVALATLVILPIKDGICWEHSNYGNGEAYTLTNSHEIDATGRGWSLYGNIFAGYSYASAEAVPSITGLKDFAETHAWIGHANVSAKANSCTVYRLKWWSNIYHKQVEIEEKTFNSSGDLRAKVVVGMRAWGEGEVEIKSNPDVTLSLTAPMDEFTGVGMDINFGGNIYVQLKGASFLYNIDSPVDISDVQTARVSSEWEAPKSARIEDSFWFGLQSIDNGVQVSNYDGKIDPPGTEAFYNPVFEHGWVEVTGFMKGWIKSWHY